MTDWDKIEEGKRLIREGGGFVVVPFVAEDVTENYPGLTLDEAADFLGNNEHRLEDLASERINEAIADLVFMDFPDRDLDTEL